MPVKQKVSLTHQEQTAREICVRIFTQEIYSKEFLNQHLDNSVPLLVPLINRLEQEIIAYLIDRLLRHATSCELDNRSFHLPCSERKLKELFSGLMGQWRDTDSG